MLQRPRPRFRFEERENAIRCDHFDVCRRGVAWLICDHGRSHHVTVRVFANLNRLPPTILSAIQHHHTPLDATEHQNLVGMVATADDMANYIQREGKIEGYDPTGNLGWYYLTEELGHCGNFEFAEEAPTIMEDALKEAEGAKSSAA